MMMVCASRDWSSGEKPAKNPPAEPRVSRKQLAGGA
jgi:hypothetical protein